MTKKYVIATITAVMAAGGMGFYGGCKYVQNQTPANGKLAAQNFQNTAAEQRQQTMQQFRGNGQGGLKNGGNMPPSGGFAVGEIINTDDASVTVKLRDGGSKIAFFSNGTSIGKIASGTPDDLAIGSQVTITGNTNSDGSITAHTIQIHP